MPRVGRAPKPQPQPDDRQVAEAVDDPVPSQAPTPGPTRIDWTLRDQSEVVEEMLTRHGDGENLRAICRDPFMPSRTTLDRWLDEDEGLAERFARAREKWRSAIEDECIDLADNATVATLELAKLKIHTRLQLLARADAVAKAAPPKLGYVPPEIHWIGVEPYRPPQLEAIEGESHRVDPDDELEPV